ncbi:DEAD/DEAH box helicase family protein [Desulfitibacter alkalitolerans]|uniref:restriction endonuclease n=1 Tax=Desulfitibacter alkalitolerans TaxID=264641 RepID=UPI00048066C7|nr:DEAD/DEAH box helicase family protein [Desulfitibacter alkalitolerans]
MKIQFDSNQEYQLKAIGAIIDIFDGQPLAGGEYEIKLPTDLDSLFQTELGVGNRLLIDEDKIKENVKKVQKHNQLPVNDDFHGMNFSIEMETGTGKTYVYLRTVYELNIRYGFTKFIIVVPSVAIREGVLKNLEITQEHFKNLYGNIPVDYWVYDSKKVSNLRHFSASNQVQILIINIDSFNKKANNVIYNEQDKLSGHKPIDFIQTTNPIVIVDEPQNMESEKAKEAIENLNPLCTLRYSATHRNLYNLLYRLDPVKAYDMRLVKQIEVDSVLNEENFNKAYISLDSIKPTKTKISAKVTIHADKPSGPAPKTVEIKAGDDLYSKSNNRTTYKDGYVVSEINAGECYVSFVNGTVVNLGQTIGGMTEDIMKVQIRETIKEHLEKELQVQDKGIKVLSLFFIDKVANYRYYEKGKRKHGKIARWFIEAYNELTEHPRYKGLIPYLAEQVHDGYFSADRKGIEKDTSGNTKADDDTYNLIMKNKEQLLSHQEPVRFIFSHSALREGWDNPNVFQICTLNETKSELKKRQEIGRGLRLPVDQTGNRVFDENINRLTVIANESYEEFALKLQQEITEECGVDFGGRIKNKRERKKLGFKKEILLDENFKALWERIKHKTRYAIYFDTSDLIRKCAGAIKDMPPVTSPKIRTQKVKLGLSTTGVDTTISRISEATVQLEISSIPDVVSYMQRETELTRSTLTDILLASERLADIRVNPQQFMDMAVKEIKRELHNLMINGIKYEKIAGQEYEMMLFEEKEIESYLSNIVPVNNSIYDHVVVDSDVERKFAEILDEREDIKLFIKLPAWFVVETPIGTYNPDWAIVKEEDKKLYLIRETKSTLDLDKLHLSEAQKIKCSKKHFEVFNDVDYKVVTSASEV